MQKSETLPQCDCPHCGSTRTRSRFETGDDGLRWFIFRCLRCCYGQRLRA